MFKARAVKRTDVLTGEIKEYKSLMEAQRDGFKIGGVWSCCNGKIKSFKGFFWQYL